MSNLKIETLIKEDLERKFKVILPATEMAATIDKKIAEIQPKYRQKGFRDGKVPVEIIKQKHLDSLLGEVANDTAQACLQEIMEGLPGENFAYQPHIEVTELGADKDLVMEVEFEVLPIFPEWDLSEVTVPSVDITIEDDDIQESIQQDLQSVKKWETAPADYVAAKGNAVKIDFVGTVDGKEFQGGKMDGYQLELGSNTFIPGFEEQLEGVKAGDNVIVKVTFPEQYHAKELAGKEAEFATKVQEVLTAITPELNDNTVKEHFHCDSVADYKTKIKNRMLKHSEMELIEEVVENLLQKVEDKFADIPLPKKILEQEIKAATTQENNLPEAERRNAETIEADARKMLLRSLFIGDLSQRNKLMISDEDVFNSIMEIAKRYPGQEKMLFDLYAKNPRMLEEMRSRQLQEKVYKFIAEHVKLDKQPISWKDYQTRQKEKAEAKQAEK